MNQSGSSTIPLKLFISYSKCDDDLREELEVHLSSLEREGAIEPWQNRNIEAGEEWSVEIRKQIEAANIILLLITPHFIASRNCYDEEMHRAMGRHTNGAVRVIPIILKPCDWEHSPFQKLLVLPKDGKPITLWENQDAAFLDVVKGIRRAIESVQGQYRSAPFIQKIDGNHAGNTEDFDELIQQIREHCRQKILSQHSRMRLLSGNEIGVGQLYVDVWLLNRSLRTFQVSPNKLLETFDLRNDRLGLGDRIDRNPGFEVANENPKLVILGKPGSGKTTFLKHLAVDWCNRKFQPNQIAVLIELRSLKDEKWDLLNAIDKELGLEDWIQFEGIKVRISNLIQQNYELINQTKNEDNEDDEASISQRKSQIKNNKSQIEELNRQLEALPLQRLLKQGKLLALMDGLDEIPINALRSKVQLQVRQISENYPNNRFILTCRTQIMGSIPVGFTSVEVADFSPKQVENFVQNWFKASGVSEQKAKEKWTNICRAVANKPDLKELTVTPVLLSLMCLVLQDEGEIPLNRIWLYRKSIKLLLSKWNADKQIGDWEMGTDAYRQLDIEDKEALLLEISARKFENPRNFVLFDEEELAEQITQQLRLTHPREGIAVLKAIEAQHGLLVERADGLWSFSHLTFQEYFTVQWLTQLSSEKLVSKIASQHWQEVMKQLVKSQQPADRLLELIKQAIDQSISHEPAVQTFLNWLFQKSQSTQAIHQPAAIRAFYYTLGLARIVTCVLGLARALDSTFDLARALDLGNVCTNDLAAPLPAPSVLLVSAPALAPRLLLLPSISPLIWLVLVSATAPLLLMSILTSLSALPLPLT